MAKESMKAREVKKSVSKDMLKRAALKAAGDYIGLQKLQNASPVKNITDVK